MIRIAFFERANESEFCFLALYSNSPTFPEYIVSPGRLELSRLEGAGFLAAPALCPFSIRLRGASRFSLRPIVHGTFAVASGRPGTWVVAP